MSDTYCPTGWELYEKWDELNANSGDAEAENAAWLAWQDHKNACPECKKVRNG
jgi:hypothetical protein